MKMLSGRRQDNSLTVTSFNQRLTEVALEHAHLLTDRRLRYTIEGGGL